MSGQPDRNGPSSEVEGLELVSRALFVSSKRLKIAEAIARHPEETFLVKDIIEVTGMESGEVLRQIRHFRLAGLVTRPKRRSVNMPHLRTPSAFWELVGSFTDEVRAGQVVPDSPQRLTAWRERYA